MNGFGVLCSRTIAVLLAGLSALPGGAIAAQVPLASPVPNAPPAHLLSMNQAAAVAPVPDSSSPAPSSSQPALTRTDAEQMAIRQNPRSSIGRLLALAQHQVVRETRSAELPTVVGSITAMDSEEASRISAGGLTSSRLFEHAGAGATATQLITDFGRTRNLVLSAKLQEKARQADALATVEDVVLATDQAFYNALQAQALLDVAKQNLQTRQTTDQQVGMMTRNKLKSTLDLSFADVNVSQSQVLLLDAQNNADSTMAALDDVLGLDRSITYRLVGDAGALPAPPADAAQLLAAALEQRPDLQALTYSGQSAVRFSRAQRDQLLPSISALGTAGTVPIRPGSRYYTTNWWGGIGVNMNIPIFNGFLFPAQTREAEIRAQAAAEQTRELRDHIVRDVRTSWLAARTAYEKVGVTEALLKNADLSLTLAETRYRMGLSSIVELSQAQYEQTDAAIGNTNAQYQYRLALATLNYEIGRAP